MTQGGRADGGSGEVVLLQWWTPAGAKSERISREQESRRRLDLLALGAVVWGGSVGR